MSDALQAVVHHYNKLVGPKAVGAPQNEVADFMGDVLRLRPLQAVNKVLHTLRHPQTPRTRLPAFWKALAAGSGVRVIAQRATGAGAAVNVTTGLQAGKCFFIQGNALRLPDRGLIPMHAQGL